MTRIKNSYLQAPALILTSLALIACNPDSTDSTNVNTDSIYAAMSLTASTAGRTRINVELNVEEENGTNIELSSGERLEASSGSESVTLEQDTDFDDIDYEGTLNTSSSADPYTITFIRENGLNIDGTSVNMPDEFTVSSPSEDEAYDSNQSLPLRWTPERSGEMIELETSTECTTDTGSTSTTLEVFELVDDGSEDWLLSNLTAADGDDIDRTIDCVIDVTLVRRATGTLDARFESGGQITATQSREIENVVLRLQE